MNSFFVFLLNLFLITSCSSDNGLKYFKYNVYSCDTDFRMLLNSGRIKELRNCEEECCDLIQLRNESSEIDTVKIAFYVHGEDAQIGPVWREKNKKIEVGFKIISETESDECLRLCIAEYVFYNKTKKKVRFCKSLISN